MKPSHRHLTGRWARHGTAEAEADAARMKARTGLSMCAHGDELAAYVARRYSDGVPVRTIAAEAGYKVDRMLLLLAQCGRAPLARALSAQVAYEEGFAVALGFAQRPIVDELTYFERTGELFPIGATTEAEATSCPPA